MKIISIILKRAPEAQRQHGKGSVGYTGTSANATTRFYSPCSVCVEPGVLGRAGWPRSPRRLAHLLSEWMLNARARGQAAPYCHVKQPFPTVVKAGRRTRSAPVQRVEMPASGTDAGGEPRSRPTGPGHPHAARLRLPPPCGRLPRAASASGTRKPRRRRVGGDTVRPPLAAISFRRQAKSPNLPAGSQHFQRPNSILK